MSGLSHYDSWALMPCFITPGRPCQWLKGGTLIMKGYVHSCSWTTFMNTCLFHVIRVKNTAENTENVDYARILTHVLRAKKTRIRVWFALRRWDVHEHRRNYPEPHYIQRGPANCSVPPGQHQWAQTYCYHSQEHHAAQHRGVLERQTPQWTQEDSCVEPARTR